MLISAVFLILTIFLVAAHLHVRGKPFRMKPERVTGTIIKIERKLFRHHSDEYRSIRTIVTVQYLDQVQTITYHEGYPKLKTGMAVIVAINNNHPDQPDIVGYHQPNDQSSMLFMGAIMCLLLAGVFCMMYCIDNGLFVHY